MSSFDQYDEGAYNAKHKLPKGTIFVLFVIAVLIMVTSFIYLDHKSLKTMEHEISAAINSALHKSDSDSPPLFPAHRNK